MSLFIQAYLLSLYSLGWCAMQATRWNKTLHGILKLMQDVSMNLSYTYPLLYLRNKKMCLKSGKICVPYEPTSFSKWSIANSNSENRYSLLKKGIFILNIFGKKLVLLWFSEMLNLACVIVYHLCHETTQVSLTKMKKLWIFFLF